ncbi:hypothetical protein WICPIJ_008720 [Wickerhamomyces pijperi]|uniref:Glycosyltransferase family 34 protein n=1 Tax=Wickerhamomyces pijperi TaxID=599730 RepID=A0A9P8PVD5_WICPI|nr:hypothetical protein WICPIJ_008720 [Wickerhamomyces pijperi]
MLPRPIQKRISVVKRTVQQNKTTTVIICTLFLYFVLFYGGSEERIVYDLSDGKSSKGYGIIKGGTGNLCYDKDRRVGGLPKVTRFDDPSIYDEFERDTNTEGMLPGTDFDDVEAFDKDRNKIVIIVGANLEGGVGKWKGPDDWALEKTSLVNKKLYAAQHGYDLVVKDFTKLKKYSNEFREGWQKFDLIKEVMDEYNYGDWFWYVDLNTLIMEPEYTLEDLVFQNMQQRLASRTVEYFNPNELTLDLPLIDYTEPLNLLLAQDCDGFNLNSFLIRKSHWSINLIDLLFDPVVYSVEHPKWTRGESNALEYYYNKFPSIRSRLGFLPTRLLASLGPGACSDYEFDSSFMFYNETSRDFLVNLKDCDAGRNCWEEMQQFSRISRDLHKSWYQRIF